MLRRVARLAPFLVFAWLALALLPEVPDPLATGVDASWQYGLNLVAAQGLRHGADVVHSIGPLAYLFYPDANYTAAAPVLATEWLAYALFFFAVFRICMLAGVEMGALAGFSGGVLMLYHLQPVDAWFTVGVLSLVAASAGRERFPLVDLTVAGAICGLSLLIKMSDGMVLVTLFAVILAAWWRRAARWQFAAAILVPTGAFLVAARGTAIVAYFAGTLRIAAAYSQVMGTAGPYWQLALAVASVLAILYLALRERVLLAALLAAILCYAVFKHGMVRQDGHAIVTQSKLALAALFVLAATVGRPHWDRWAAITVLSSAGSIAIVHADPSGIAPRIDARAVLARVPETVANLAAWNTAWQNLAARNRAIVEPLKLPAAFSAIIGTEGVDAYPNNIETIRANGWRYAPRWAMQSMVAYTPPLDRANAEHLTSRAAARFVVLEPGTIDEHHIAFEDPLSWRALIDHYAIRLRSPRALLLQRTHAAPRFQPPELIASVLSGWNRETPLPQVGAREALLMKVRVRRSPFGALANALLRGTPVYFQLSRAKDGRQSFGRVVVPQLESGILVDPLPRDLEEIAGWFGSLEGAERGVRILFWNHDWLEYEPDIRIEWYRVRPAL